MSNKREEILTAALHLFNDLGIEKVTTRDIAKEINISLGNLTYYFPSKNDIILALCREFIDKVDEALANAKPEKNILLTYYKQVEIIFITQLKFSFIMNKRYGEIIDSLPSIQKYYQEVLKGRFDFFKQVNEQMVKEKLAKPTLVEEVNAHSYMINILALYWHQEILIYLPKLKDKEKISHALAIFFQAYKPYLTKKGLEELTPLLKKLEHY
jgi:AcrR family transcriptional regulator